MINNTYKNGYRQSTNACTCARHKNVIARKVTRVCARI